ncbi:uncharacterized protein METZ01_LOCUS495 [marine metagenome]|uniref:Uncharacterized protein n=1 Tax=marine metagenome TaxID=408172 RepID=A0A381MZ95_9ZZZZ
METLHWPPNFISITTMGSPVFDDSISIDSNEIGSSTPDDFSAFIIASLAANLPA